ncbi:hypothetical protein AeMF1_013038 [Aphanomyces euteiches]|nr:hypothetical protein AeMF1_013038 [Aphanomyces euteiches]KAH9195631.1 hypothetical protein AeNC1_002381 [Aphanomyces euteiches]
MFTVSKSMDAISASMCTMKLCRGSNFTIEDFEAWCNQTTKNPIVLTVSDPEIRGSYIKKHTTYAVRQENTMVRRRYSDFEWLHATLSGRYIGMLVPSLPEKLVYKTEAYIRSRMRGLTIFINQVMLSPFLRHDVAVVAFLTIADDAEWDQAKKSSAVTENGGVGHLKWMQCLLNTDVPEDPDKFIVGIKRDVELIEKCCVDIGACTKRLGEKAAALSKDLSELHVLFNEWKNNEFNGCDDKDTTLNSLLSATTTTTAGWHDVHYHQPAIHELMLHEGIKYIVAQVKDFKDIFKQREAAMVQYEKSTKQTTPPKASWYSSEPNPVEIEGRYDHVINCINRALFFSEAKRFKTLKADLLRDTMGPFACAEHKVAKRLSSLWSNFLAAAEISQPEMMTTAKSILDSADVAVEPKDNQED